MGLQNTPDACLLWGKTPPMSFLDRTLNNLMSSFSKAKCLGNAEYLFITIAPRSTLAQSGVTWSTTKRREMRNFPYPSVFELTGRQRLIVKRGIRNVGRFLAAEVTNPGQNESQQMFALCDQMDKEGDILDRDSSPNESPDRVKEGERGRMIGQNPKNGSSTLFVCGNRETKCCFEDGGHHGRTDESHAKLRAKKQSRVSGQHLE